MNYYYAQHDHMIFDPQYSLQDALEESLQRVDREIRDSGADLDEIAIDFSIIMFSSDKLEDDAWEDRIRSTADPDESEEEIEETIEFWMRQSLDDRAGFLYELGVTPDRMWEPEFYYSTDENGDDVLCARIKPYKVCILI